jgi:hypothetical protein
MSAAWPVKPGRTPATSATPSSPMSRSMRCSVVRDFCGHGLGKVFHDAPNILHFGQSGHGRAAEARHVLHHRADGEPGQAPGEAAADGWTAVTRDKSLSAQCEHSSASPKTATRSSPPRPRVCSSRRFWAPSAANRSASRPTMLAIASACASGSGSAASSPCPTTSCSSSACSARFPRGDVKPLAKRLLTRFGSLGGVLGATPEELKRTVSGRRRGGRPRPEAAARGRPAVWAATDRKRPVISSWTALLAYVRRPGHERASSSGCCSSTRRTS